jgi:hypothetical protein
MDPTVQRATCAAVLDVLLHTSSENDAQHDEIARITNRVADHIEHFGAPVRLDGLYSQPPTPPSAVDAVLSWCARELDRVGVP